MEGQARVSGAVTRDVELGGRKYRLGVFRVGDYAATEARVVSLRPDPLEFALAATARAPESQHARIWAAALEQADRNRYATSADVARFLDSLEGVAWQFYRCALRHDPGVDLATIHAALLDLDQNAVRAISLKVRVASGELELGNSSGQPNAADTNPAASPPAPAGP